MKKRIEIEKLFDTALNLYARYGYKKTTLEDIANELGMTKGNLYRYVKNKRDLYEKSVAYNLIKWQEKVLEEISEEQDIKKQFKKMCVKAYKYLSEDKNLRAILIQDPSIFPTSPKDDRFSYINQASIELISNLLRNGIKSGVFRDVDVEYVSEFLFSIYVMFIVKTYVKSESFSIQKMLDEGLDVLLNGLLK